MAAEYMNAEATEALLNGGADPNIQSFNSQSTPLFIAAQNSDYAVGTLLLEEGNADPDIPNVNGTSPGIQSTDINDHRADEILIEYSADPNLREYTTGETALHKAAQQGYTDVVKLILDYDRVDPNVQDYSGETPLFSAAWLGFSDEVLALLDGGADPDIANNEGVTPLMQAVIHDHFDSAQYIVEHGVNINQQNNVGNTALNFACDDNDEQMAKLLIDAGANPNLQNDAYGLGCLHYAAYHNNLKGIQYILANSAVEVDVNLMDFDN